MGWIYYTEWPMNWSNASERGIYHIIDAPHVIAANKDPRWECTECGFIYQGAGPLNDCPSCVVLARTKLAVSSIDKGTVQKITKELEEMLKRSGGSWKPFITRVN